MICWSCKHLGWHFVCFKKLTACNPGDSLRMLAGWAWRVVSVSARVIWFMLSSGTLHGNATHSFQGIVSSDGKLHGPLQHGELQLHTHNSPACSWNTPLSESQNRDVILDSYCSLSCLFLSLFFFSNPSHAGHCHSSSGFLQQWCNWYYDHSHFSDFVCYSLIMGRTPYPKLFLGKYLLVFQDSTQMSSPPGNLSLPPKTKSGASSLTSCVCGCAHACTCTGAQSCFFDPMDCSPPGSSVHGIPRQEYWSQ